MLTAVKRDEMSGLRDKALKSATSSNSFSVTIYSTSKMHLNLACQIMNKKGFRLQRLSCQDSLNHQDYVHFIELKERNNKLSRQEMSEHPVSETPKSTDLNNNIIKITWVK